MSASSAKKSIKIIGGGASGLFAAYHLKKLGHDVEIFEKANRLGGLIQTFHLDWGLVETAANGVLNSAKFEEFSHDLNLELIPAQKKYKKRFIFRGRPRRFPLSFLESFKLIKSLFGNVKPNPRESLRAFAERSFGVSAAKYLIEPAVLGVFGAESEELSASLVYTYFFGGARKAPENKTRRGTVAPRAGMSELIQSLEKWLVKNGVKIHLSQSVEPLKLSENSSTIHVIATDAVTAGELLTDIDQQTSHLLKEVQYKPLTSVTLAYEEDSPIKGFGCLFPRDQGFQSYGVLFNTCIFPDRGPQPTETWILPDAESAADELLEKVSLDSERLYRKKLKVKNSLITIWPRALPLYSTKLEEDLKLLSLPSGYYITGNYLGQIGLSRIFETAHKLALRIDEEN